MQNQPSIVSAEMEARSLEVLRESLKATKRVRAGKGEYTNQPDYSTRLKAAELLLAYQFGRPVSNTKSLNVNVSESRQGSMSQTDIIKALAKSGGDGVDDILSRLQRKSGNGSLSVLAAVNDDAVVDV